VRAGLRRGLRALRKQYRETLRRGMQPGGAVYQEWLRDNYYLIERESRAALRELRRCKASPEALTRMLGLCRQLCHDGRMPESRELCRALQGTKCGSAEIALAPLALRLALALAAGNSAQEKEPEAKVALISGVITSFRALPEIDFDAVLEQICPLEKKLRRDSVYASSDEKTRALYRYLIERLSKKERTSEEEYAQQLYERSGEAREGGPARHVGIPLLELARNPQRGQILLLCETIVPVFLAFSFSLVFWAWYLFPLLCMPLWALCKIALEAIFLRGVDPLPLPRLDLSEIPPEGRTLVTVSNLLPPAAKAESLAKRMEELRNSNGGPNVAVCILADLKGADEAVLPSDEADLCAARVITAELNEKYGGGFMIAVRHRSFSPTMGSYAGRERKRGAISDLVALIRGEGGTEEQFCLLTGDLAHLHETKYLLALDADTELPLDSVLEFVSAALHPANKPVFDPALGRVVRGYGILAPHVELDLDSTRKSPFAHAMAGEGGNSPYSNQVSERYQDLFGCGIFAGKGLIDIEAFAMLERARPFPEEQVLSHDILEGGYLRTGFLADVSISDGFPARQNSYFTRQERWVRGDWQNLIFLRKKYGLPALGRYQLFDNLRRSMLAPACLLAIFESMLAPRPISYILAAAGVLGICGSYLVSAMRCLCSGGFAMLARDYYSGGLPAALGDITRAALQLVTLAQAAWTNACAAVRGVWRSFVTQKKRLEWTTAAQGDAAKSKFKSLLPLWPSLAAGLLLITFGRQGHRLLGMVLLANLLFAPLSARAYKNTSPKLDAKDAAQVQKYCADMWNYFEAHCTEEHNFLPPDNVQETPVYRVAPRSSPTNIGLYLLCILAARDLGLIDDEGLENRLHRSLSSIEQLERWQGNLLNWYDTRTLQPLEPRYVSTVDSGNLVVCLRVLRIGLNEYCNTQPGITAIQNRLRKLEEGCDLLSLYHHRRKIFHIGIDLSSGQVSPSYYDLLMSESRMTSYYAIAARLVPKKHWGALGRTLAKQGRFTGPVSWTGTMFEYFMPYLFLDAPKGSLGYEALRFCLHCQQRRVAKQKFATGRQAAERHLKLPWGNSESGFYAFDPCLNYQYKAHGTQKLGLRRGLDEELVLSPYSSFLAMQLAPRSAMRNLRRFEQMQLYGSCGFYEAADATPARANGHEFAVVRSYMAHHVGMSMLAALNTLQDGILRRRFFSDGEMASAKSLLFERIPDRAAVYRDVELRDTLRPREKASNSKQIFQEADPAAPRTHILSNGEWSCVMSDSGACASFYRGVSILKHSKDILRRPSGVLVMLREAGREPTAITPAPYYNATKTRIEFSSKETLHYGEGLRAGVTLRTRVHPRLPAEERRVQIKNLGRQCVKGSLWLYLEPSLAPMREEAEHPAFSKLFLTENYDDAAQAAFFTRRKQETGETLCLAVACSENINASCVRSREIALRRGLPFGTATLDSSEARSADACAAFEVPYQLAAGESQEFSLFLCAGVSEEEAGRRLEQLRGETIKNPRRAGAPYPFRDGEMADALARRILPKLLFYAPVTPLQALARTRVKSPPQALWSVGVSGDMPYLYIPVGMPEELPSLQPYFTLFRRLRSAGIPCELALGYREGGDYDAPVSAALKEALHREGCSHLLYQRGGVHLVNIHRAAPEAIEALEAYAAEICDGCSTEEAIFVEPPLRILPTQAQPAPARKGLKAGNGTFHDGMFAIEKEPLPPPVPWSLPLCNPSFGTLVSDSALGFTWAVNARENKLSPWYNDPCCDNQGELLLLKFGSKVYDMLRGARCEFTPEHARWFGQMHGLSYEVKAYVPAKGLTKRVEVRLTNQTGRHLTPELAYYLEPVLGTRREPHLPVLGESLPDGLLLHSPASMIKGYTALLLQGGTDYICTDRAEFMRGRWNASSHYPQADPCAAVGRRLLIPPGEATVAEFALSWGAQRNAALCAHLVADSSPIPHSSLLVQTPDEALNHMVNTWLPHQVTACRLYGRTGHSQCGGAWGMRDQLQDVSALALTRPDLLRQQVARCAAAQFPEGDAMHWWHRLPGHATRGVRSRYADDYLWLPFVCSDYVLQTGDYAFLQTMIPFREGKALYPDEHERYAAYPLGKERASLYEHCARATDRALGLMGPRGLPLMMGGDWNDGMNNIGIKGQGESVWLGMFLSITLERMARLCDHEKDHGRAQKYREESLRLKEALDLRAWTGDRYLRAFWDDGLPLGGGAGLPCSIDLLPQSFAVLCGMPDEDRRRRALDSAAAHLVDRHGMIRLLREPFTHQSRRAGYINDYPPGMRENGGQYTHAAMWFIMALLREGRADEAYNCLQIINPADFCQNEERMLRYRGEPYAMAGDVCAAPGCEGRAGWTLYTGSAAWFLRCVTEELLGIRMDHGIISVNPCLLNGWRREDVKATLAGANETRELM